MRPDFHRYAINYDHAEQAVAWSGILDMTSSIGSQFTALSRMNQKGIISNLHIRDLGPVISETDECSLIAIVTGLRQGAST